MKNSKILLSVFMVLVIICVSVAPAFAIVAPEDVVSTTVHWSAKIDELVKEKMDEVSDNEKIPVWVWFTDIDDSNVEAMVEKQTGLTRDKLSVETNVDTEELISALATASVEDSEKALSDVKTEMKTYLDLTKEEREIEREQTNTYLKAMRSIKSDLYVANNEKIIKELKVDEKDITFQSTLTPSSIMNLTKAEIVDIAKSDDVVSVDYYENLSQPDPLWPIQRDIMQVDAVHEQLGLTGKDVVILLNERRYVRKGVPGYSELENISLDNIVVIRDGKEYLPTDTYAFPTANDSDNHATCSAAVIKTFAIDSHIYSTGDNYFSDIEFVLNKRDNESNDKSVVDILCANVNYGSSTSYTNNAYAKWFDSLVSEYDVTLIAAAGNSEAWQKAYWPTVISPANSFNSIAVGAYETNGNALEDRMNNFRYGPTEASDSPCYKPDLVVAAGATSVATPELTGIVAMMMELAPSLASQPEAVKAILMASCHRKVKPCTDDEAALPDEYDEMTDGLTQKQGAGAVDAFRAMQIILQGNYGFKEITSLSQNATSFDLTTTDDLNVSIAWSRENVHLNNERPLQTDLGTLQELELRIYSNGQMPASSTVTNAGKQLAYKEDATPGNYYVSVRKKTENTEDVTYGYAWSTKSYMEPQIELKGKTAIGHTLTADIKYRNEYSIPEELISYTWKRSLSGTSWETIIGANSKNYTLTDADFLYYIKCNASMITDTLPLTSIHGVTSPMRMIKFGDIDYDMAITMVDATMINQYVSNEINLSAEQLYAADVDGDGQVTNLDVTYIQQYRAGMITSFPVENNE